MTALEWLVMARAPGFGRGRLSALMEVCPDPHDVFKMSPGDLLQVRGWSRTSVNAFLAARSNSEARRAAEIEWERAKTLGLKLVALPDPDYPVRLRHTPEPPPYFYQFGPWVPDDRPMVAIVGTRRATAYGLSVAERFGRELAEAGAVIVSGMARGIDCAAHRGALRAGGTTIAVLGGGADICYPREAAKLYAEIKATGAVISEQSPGAEPRREFFPERNRIISGLAHGLLVVEAGEHSGTLITVAAALRQGRDVFAVPGPITSPVSSGPHALIRDGACLVTDPAQILEELGFKSLATQSPKSTLAGLSHDEAHLATWMGMEPRGADDLALACGLRAAEVQAILTILELRGIVRQLPDGQYIRVG